MATSTFKQPCFYVTNAKDIEKIHNHVASFSTSSVKSSIDIADELKKGQETLVRFKSSLLKTYSK